MSRSSLPEADPKLPVNITKLEAQLLTDIAHSDHSSDGYGYTMWVGCGYETMSMSQARGVISSLIQKEIVWFSPANLRHGDEFAHVCPRESFVISYEMNETNNRFDSNPFTVGCHGYKYVNLKVIE